ncbi:MAG: hypothetical protein ACRCZI_00385, partial [Cetobacterium sp.]
MNEWKFITLKATPNSTPEEQDDELNAVFSEVLHEYEVAASDAIVQGGFGAMDTTDPAAKEGYYLIKWTSKPYQLQRPARVQGCEATMPAATWVCDGRYLDRLDRSPHWYHYNPRARVDKFRLQFIVACDIQMEAYDPDNGVAPPASGLSSLTRRALDSARTTLMRVPEEMQQKIAEEKVLRDKLDHFEVNIE